MAHVSGMNWCRAYDTSMLCHQGPEEACVANVGEGLQPYNSGDDSSKYPTLLLSKAAAEWHAEACAEGGDINPDSLAHFVTMPPVLLLTAYRFMQGAKHELVWMPLLTQMTGEWCDWELTDVSILVARLFFWHNVFRQSVISLEQLLGGMDVGEHNIELCVPNSHFHVFDIKSHVELTDHAQLAPTAATMDRRWAYQGPGSPGPDSWIILQQGGENEQSTSGVVVLVVQSKKCPPEESLQSQQLCAEASKILRIPGAESLMLYVSDQHRSCQGVATSSFDVSKDTLLVNEK